MQFIEGLKSETEGGHNCCCWKYCRKNPGACDDYNRIVREVTDLGFIRKTLNLEIEVTKSQKVIDDEEKLIEKMMEKDVMTSRGRLFKLGMHVANAVAETTAGQKKIELVKIKKA